MEIIEKGVIMLFETICIQNGSIQHLSYHQARFDKSREQLFGSAAPKVDLAEAIKPPSTKGILKCRLIYSEKIEHIEYAPYKHRRVRRVKLVESSIRYPHKLVDREELENLFEMREEADDILIVRNGLVTDTSIANIAFYNGKRWLTPKSPLLAGTTRERLIRSGFLIPRDIAVDELDSFKKFALLNAMIGFEIVENGIISR